MGQLTNVEIKINAIMKRSEATFKQQLLGAALEAADCLEQGAPRGVSIALIKGLSLFRDLAGGDPVLSVFVDPQLLKRAVTTLGSARLPDHAAGALVCQACRDRNKHRMLVSLASAGEWGDLLRVMIVIHEQLVKEDAKETPLAMEDSQHDLPSSLDSDGESPEEAASLNSMAPFGIPSFGAPHGERAKGPTAHMGAQKTRREELRLLSRSNILPIVSIMACLALLCVLAAGPPEKDL